MRIPLEKRAYSRCSTDTPILFALYNTERYRHAQALNFSRGGMNFETPADVRPGTAVHIRMEPCPETVPAPGAEGRRRPLPFFCQSAPGGEAGCGGLNTHVMAEVKWCRKLTPSPSARYRVGVVYYQPAV
ncbi:MAG: PilZ domain-containing protein [Desulfobacterales bacterium]|nr:PilZ domain-containing protein [Desulfobacterales bacterium]